jgi:predicted aspartyl protease
MISGQVVAGREAVIALTLHGTHGQVLTRDAVVDTGFTGFLTLPLPEIAQLGFPYQGLIDARLGNGQPAEFDMFAGMVLWDGQVRTGIVLAAEGMPLVGMALLRGSRLCLDIMDGGPVTIEPLP